METWKPVVGWEGMYEVSDHGRVRSVDRRDRLGRTYRGQMLRQYRAGGRHFGVHFCRNGERHNYLVHRLVLEAFVGPCPEGMVALHGPAGEDDNRPQNLHWGTQSENMRDRRRDGTDHNVNRTECPYGHALRAPNLVACKARHGHRNCLACNRERGAARSAGRAFDPKRADIRFRELVAEAA